MPAFDALLNQTLTVDTKISRDRYGKPSFGTSTTVPCRFDNHQTVKILPNKQEITIDAIAMVDPTVTVKESDRIIGPDGNHYKLYSVNVAPDRFGDAHHIELEMQLWQL